MIRDWAIIAFNSAIATLLISAGLVKMTSPGRLHRALAELMGNGTFQPPRGLVRIAAAVELLAGVLIIGNPTRDLGAWFAAILGLGFLILGFAGKLRGSVVPCGCLGERSGAPLGFVNLIAGVFLVAGLPLNLLPRSSGLEDGYPFMSASLVAASITLWAAYSSRRVSPMLARLLRARATQSEVMN